MAESTLGAAARPAARRQGVSHRWSLLCVMGAVTAVVTAFGVRQNVSPVLGGPISLPKLLWLNYALLGWFVVPWFLWRHPHVIPSVRRIFTAHLISMCARGVTELWMLYVTVSWSPVYGITQDLFQIALIAMFRCISRRPATPIEDHFNQAVRRFCTSIQLSLCAEIVFAALFYQTGAHRQAIYFASSTEPYRFINALTVLVDIAVYTNLAVFLWRQRTALFRGLS